MAGREIEFLGEGLRRHVKALAVDIGPRTPFSGDSLERAAVYIQSAFQEMGLSVIEQPNARFFCRVSPAELIAASHWKAERTVGCSERGTSLRPKRPRSRPRR